MSSEFGKNIHISIFGESHGEGIGAVIDGLPAGERIDLDEVQAFLNRRAPGNAKFSTARKEADFPEVLSGMLHGRTTGAPLAVIFRNSDTRSQDYDKLRALPRPSHSDFAAHIKFGGFNDVRGGGHFSGRITAPLCFAGALAIQLLRRKGVHIAAHILSIGNIEDEKRSYTQVDEKELAAVAAKAFPVFNDKAGEKMLDEIERARLDADSVGGIIELFAKGLPAGIGSPMFDGVESRIAQVVFGIPAVRGIEFGTGFQAAKMRGSEHNDPYYYDEEGNVRSKSNHHGGVLGGITTAMPLVLRTAIKPTASIGKEQDTINLNTKENSKLVICGRHDPCIVPRAVPCVEAAAAVVLLDLML